MKIKLKANFTLIIVLVLASLFFISTASFNYITQEAGYIKWTSPDESANYFFAHRFSQGKPLAWFDEAAIIGDNMVMPRSFRSDFGWLKPVSFLGIILIYGFLASLVGSFFIPFFTPLLAALGIVVYYAIIKKILNKRIALISATLLTFFPVYIYYSVRSMFHNVLFIVLLLFARYFLLLSAKEKEKTIFKNEKTKIISLKKIKSRFLNFKLGRNFYLQLLASFIGGIFLGLAAITRLSELIWLAPALLLAWLFYLKRYNFTKVILILAGIFLAFIPNIYFNQLLYSAPLYGGYNEMNKSLDDISEASSGIVESLISGGDALVYFKTIYHNIFYFGFDFTQSLQMAGHYILEMFPVLSILFILGFLLIVFKSFLHFEKKYLVYFLLFLCIASVLIFYYGSWQFNDNPDPNRFTIGNSYTRYWLPIYLMMIPIASLLIYRLSRAVVFSISKYKSFKSRQIVGGIQILAVLAMAAISVDFVLYGSEEGIVHLYYNNLREKEHIEELRQLTEDNSIIITKYYDKFLFPERRVIMGLIPNDELLRSASKLVQYYPLYYYNFSLPEDAIIYLNERKLGDYNLQIKTIKRISHDFSLYTLKASSPELRGTTTIDIESNLQEEGAE